MLKNKTKGLVSLGKGRKLCTFVDVTDETPVQKLSVTDQLRVLMHQITYDEASELSNQDAVEQERLILKADLLDFLHKSTEPIRRGKTKRITVQVSSKFLPVLDDVLSSRSLVKQYTIKVAKPKIDYDLPFDILVRLAVKEVNNV